MEKNNGKKRWAGATKKIGYFEPGADRGDTVINCSGISRIANLELGSVDVGGIDDVFTTGHGSLYANDGRSRSDASKKYGSGGLIHDKKYMLSLTWNAPMEAFDDADQFFHGVGVDGVYLPFHKANQFLGMSTLPTFIVNDVIKMPDVDSYVEAYKAHLNTLFAAA